MSLAALQIPFYPAHQNNYTPGRTAPIDRFTVHHMAGTPNTLRYLWGDPNRNGSSHYGCFPGYIEQYVKIGDTAWCNSNWPSNCRSITVENYGDWRNGYVNWDVLAQLKKLMKAARQEMPHLQLDFHGDVTDPNRPTECPAQLRGYAQRIWDEVTQELATPAPTPQPAPQITYEPIPKKTVTLKWASNLWNFNFTDWGAAQSKGGYPAGYAIDVVAIARNALGGRYYMTEYSYNGGNIRATNGFNVADCQDYVAPAPQPTPTPEPTPTPQPEPPVVIKYTRYEKPIRVVTTKEDTVLWDFSGKTWGEIEDHPQGTYKLGHPIDIVGDAQHPLGGVYLMTAFSMGDGDVKSLDFKPHHTWGFNAADVKEVDPVPTPQPEPTPDPEPTPEPPTEPSEPAQGDGPTNAGPGDLNEPEAGEDARTFVQRVIDWVLQQLSKFKR